MNESLRFDKSAQYRQSGFSEVPFLIFNNYITNYFYIAPTQLQDLLPMKHPLCIISFCSAIMIINTNCNSIKIKSLYDIQHSSPTMSDCYKENEVNSKLINSAIEEEFLRMGAFKSKGIKMLSDFGLLEKTVRLYVVNRTKFFLVFHLQHIIDQEIKDYTVGITGNSDSDVLGKVTIDSKITVGDITIEHLYINISKEQLHKIATSQKLSITMDDIVFTLPYDCRETFRETQQKYCSESADVR
jgi:hypothetical protein